MVKSDQNGTRAQKKKFVKNENIPKSEELCHDE